MKGAADQLLALIDDEDPYSYGAGELEHLQLEAIRERLDERRDQIPLLARKAGGLHGNEINALQDVVPLLFSHTTYKSYPESFVSGTRWDRLLQWYGTVSVGDTSTVDVDGVRDLDEWVASLWSAGLFPYASSGTSGKCSFLPNIAADRANTQKMMPINVCWPRPVKPQSLRWYQLMPGTGSYGGIDRYRLLAEVLAKPGTKYCLGDEPMLLSEISYMSRTRKAMANGTATPADVAELDRSSSQRRMMMGIAMQNLVSDLLEHPHEPVAVVGLWSQHWEFMQAARKAGVPNGSFHPDSVVSTGGGTKGAVLPPDYREQIDTFYGNVHRHTSYGMTEMTSTFPMCEAGRYHQAPWCVTFLLDESGERVLAPENGRVRGRTAFVDIAAQGRWGGIISADLITIDTNGCPCGRSSPTVIDDVTRYSEADDDKLTCAGTVDAYIGGVMQ